MSIEIVMVKTKNLKPAEYNPRLISKHDADQLAHSMSEFGVVDPIIVNSHPSRKNIIIGGHQRYYIAKKLNYEELPVVYVSIADIKREKELNIRLNKNIGEWDWEKLANEFDVDFLKEIGFTDDEMSVFPAEDIEEDEVPEAPKKARAKRGQIYLLGRHRLMCGDSTIKEDVGKLMNGQKADMVFTDPPYGMGLNTDYSDMKGWHQGKKYEKIIGDNEDFNNDFINNIFSVFADVKEKFLFGADYYVELLPNYGKDGSWFVWDKRVDENKDKMFGSGFEMLWSENRHQRRLLRGMWAGFMGDAEASKRVHPTQKPTKILVEIINEYSEVDNKVVDVFGGSGSTLIACEQTNRKCYMMELDEKYCDVIIERYCNLVGADKEEIYAKAEK